MANEAKGLYECVKWQKHKKLTRQYHENTAQTIWMNTTTTLTLNNKVSSGLYALYLDTSKTLPFSSRLAPWHGEGSSTIRRPTSAFNCTSPMCSWNIIICQALTLIFLLSTQCINSLYPWGCKLVLDHNLLPIRLFLFSLSSIVKSTLKKRKYQLPVAIFDIQDVNVLVA